MNRPPRDSGPQREDEKGGILSKDKVGLISEGRGGGVILFLDTGMSKAVCDSRLLCIELFSSIFIINEFVFKPSIKHNIWNKNKKHTSEAICYLE